MKSIPLARKRFRKGRKPFWEVICTCEAYKYPHRFGSGYCNGVNLVRFFWEHGYCEDCRYKYFDDWDRCPSCQVLNGREKVVECEQLQEFLRVNEAYSKKLPKR